MKTDAPSPCAQCSPALVHVVRKSGLIALVACFLCGLLAPLPVSAQDDASGQLGPEALAIAQAINSVRASNGLGPLRVNSLLNQAAQNHVDDLIANGIYGHYGSDGSTLRTRVARTGYPSQWVSENWVTSGSTQGAMDWWMNDWIHRVNILDASWDEVGIGAGQVSNGYWIFVTDFANVDGMDSHAPVATAAEAPAATTATAAVVEPESETLPAEGMDYTVRAGDTLLQIGLRYGLEWQDIAIANGLAERDVLRIGQVLRLPGIVTAGPVTEAVTGALYTVQAGDTLIGIATRHSIDWEDIAVANRLGEYSIIQPGMQLRLPGVESVEDAGDAVAATVAEAPQAVENQPIVYTTELLPAGASGFSAGTSGGASYTVKEGDTLFAISVRSGITWQQLADANNLDADGLIRPGQTLVLPTGAGQAAAPAAAAVPAPAAPARTHTVKAGETVISIALQYDIGWKELLARNGLDDNTLIQPGDVLQLP